MEGNVVQQINIHEAKTHLSMLVEKAAKGESFIIAKAGKPMVTVLPYHEPQKNYQRVVLQRPN
jgi:prevent-host-death family protein